MHGNEPLLLDGKNAWIVESGSVALFSIEVLNEKEHGPRRLQLQVDAGEAIIGGLSAGTSRFRILAIAVNQAELRVIPAPDLITAAAHGDRVALAYLENWSQKLAAVLNESIALSTLRTPAALQDALAGLEHRWFQAFESSEQRSLEQERARLMKRQSLNQQLNSHTLSELVSVLKDAGTDAAPGEGTPLLRALQEVGRVQGIIIKASTGSGARGDALQMTLQASRVRSRRVVLAGDWWASEGAPLLGFWEDSKEPVALMPLASSMFSKSRYEIFNPATNTRTPVDAKTQFTVSPLAFTLYRPLSERISSFEFLRFVLKGRTRDMLTLTLTGIAVSCLGMLTPQAMAVLVEQAIPDANRGYTLQIGLGLLAAAAGSLLFELAQSASILRLEIGSSSALQYGVWDRLLKLSPAFFRRYTTGDLASRAGAINTIRQQLSGATLRTLFLGVTSLLNLALMFYYSSMLALVSIGIVVAVMVVTISAGAVVTRIIQPLQEIEGHLFGLMVQLVSGVPKLRVAAAEERAFAHWARTYSRQQKLKRRQQQVQDRLRIFNLALPTLSAALIFWVVEEFLRENGQNSSGFALGTFLAFNAAFGTFFAGATSLSDTGIELLGIPNLWKRARVILDERPEVDGTKVHPGKLRGRVSLEHVTFRYRADGPLTLDDLTIEAAEGQCIALVGPSGGGKSTVLNLLLRFEIPSSGAIYYDGQNLDSLDVTAVRRQLGVVLQENKIMAGSIFDNIVCGSLCTLDEAWEAARAAAFDIDIEAMPMKMHTPISEGGGNISAGQKQRLLIARALVMKPSILIFDEATSALDNRTQATVTESLRQLKVTTILVAHRLSTIRHADRIYVIEAGRIVQQGTFDELARQEGLFARLMKRQMI